MEKVQAKNEVILASAELVKRGLVARTWGNISCRIDEKYFAITPSGIGYDRLEPEMIVVTHIDTLEHEGEIKPSSEKGIHAAAYKANPETNYVIHTHQTYATCVSVAGFSNLAPSSEEKAKLGGEILLAGYGLPGTKKLKNNVAAILEKGCCAILMEKHGALITGKDRESAFDRANLLEEICKRAVAALPDNADIPEFFDGASDEISSLQGENEFLYEKDGDRKTYKNDDKTLPDFLKLHAALLSENPGAKVLARRGSKICDALIKAEKKLPAVLDDFAQMVGNDAKCVPSGNIPKIVKACRGRNGVFVSGLGALCFASDKSDTEALLTLMEKNALAFLHAKKYGKPPVLSFIDRKLMRFVYLKKYSKKK